MQPPVGTTKQSEPPCPGNWAPQPCMGLAPLSPVGLTPQSHVGLTPQSHGGLTPQPHSHVGLTPQSPVGLAPQSYVGLTPQSPIGLTPWRSIVGPSSVWQCRGAEHGTAALSLASSTSSCGARSQNPAPAGWDHSQGCCWWKITPL
uniref:Uncharacterized protein n=1 Tax=Junco hyemalis TaxID=40217 RepID=A0A8C5J1R0_JUNHY